MPVIPCKKNPTDAGYDLIVIHEYKKINNVLTMYDTGIQIEPEKGYYAEIIARSSLCKEGFRLANSVGIIDNTYRGNLIIPLLKVDPSVPDPVLPFRRCQLIVRRQYFADFIETDLSTTERGNGGFGTRLTYLFIIRYLS